MAATMAISTLVIGDHYAAQFQLKTLQLPNGYDITAAELISATVVDVEHSQQLCDVVDQVPTEDDQLNVGKITVQFTKDVTEQLRSVFTRKGFAMIELQVRIVGLDFTWFHDVEVVPGYIS